MATTQESLDRFTAAIKENTEVQAIVAKRLKVVAGQLDRFNQLLLQVKNSEGNVAMIGKLATSLGKFALGAVVRGA